MKITVKISGTLRGIIDGLPPEMAIEKTAPLTINQVAADLGIPPILIVMAFVDGVKRSLNHQLTHDAEIYLMGPVAGG